MSGAALCPAFLPVLLTFASAGAAASVPPAVSRSTAARYELAAEPADIPEIKRRIELDQEEVRKARAAYKRAERGDSPKAKARARDAWLAAKEALKADRRLLRRAIEAHEAEASEAAGLRRELRKTRSLKP
ncbi:MAG: hypothetical protein HY554_16600 [Elusimicrobia bacterium]|nr:hypothetical protein [Elusimicrobiota bacterium]